jgi:hypothetical protein
VKKLQGNIYDVNTKFIHVCLDTYEYIHIFKKSGNIYQTVKNSVSGKYDGKGT